MLVVEANILNIVCLNLCSIINLSKNHSECILSHQTVHCQTVFCHKLITVQKYCDLAKSMLNCNLLPTMLSTLTLLKASLSLLSLSTQFDGIPQPFSDLVQHSISINEHPWWSSFSTVTSYFFQPAHEMSNPFVKHQTSL